MPFAMPDTPSICAAATATPITRINAYTSRRISRRRVCVAGESSPLATNSPTRSPRFEMMRSTICAIRKATAIDAPAMIQSSVVVAV